MINFNITSTDYYLLSSNFIFLKNEQPTIYPGTLCLINALHPRHPQPVNLFHSCLYILLPENTLEIVEM